MSKAEAADDLEPSARRDIVVGFADAASSALALQRAIEDVQTDEAARLVVVHASSSPITVRNGPSAVIAQAMGEPVWSTVHTTALELGADADRTLTIIEPGEALPVLARHGATASVIYLGPSRRRVLRRRGIGRRLGALVDCPIVEMAAPTERSAPSRARSRVPRAQGAPTLQPGATS